MNRPPALTSGHALTHHASVRASQRGVTHDLLNTLLAYADFEARAGGGCTILRCSREGLQRGELRAALGPKADRLASLAIVVADDSAEIVTVLHDHGRSSGRRYRRDN